MDPAVNRSSSSLLKAFKSNRICSGTLPFHRFGDLEIDGGRRMVLIGAEEIDLSPLEFDLRHALARRRGALVTRTELLREVWGYRAGVESRTVDTHVAKLRAKVDRDGTSRITTVRKKGYRLR